jgi:hypothetical protein
MSGESEARMNIKTGSKAEAKFPPLSRVLPVMVVKQVRGVVMAYGGEALKTLIHGLHLHARNMVISPHYRGCYPSVLGEWIK